MVTIAKFDSVTLIQLLRAILLNLMTIHCAPTDRAPVNKLWMAHVFIQFNYRMVFCNRMIIYEDSSIRIPPNKCLSINKRELLSSCNKIILRLVLPDWRLLHGRIVFEHDYYEI